MNPSLKNKLKDWMLPIAMVGGIVFYKWIDYLTFLSPLLIFVMLTITYCRVEPRNLRVGKFQWGLLATQMLMSGMFWLLFIPFGETVAGGVFICVFVPTATAAPVITGMLGGSITRVATYSLISNLMVAIVGPIVLAAIGDHPNQTFIESFYMICSHVMPLLLLPIITAFILRYSCKKIHDEIAHNQSISFYLWAVALFIVVGSSVSSILRKFSLDTLGVISSLLIGSAMACAAQFYLGRKVGGHFNDKVTGGQSLGQKNTVLAIWLALAYLDEIASVAPAAYVAWHNIVNSYQLIRHNRRHAKS